MKRVVLSGPLLIVLWLFVCFAMGAHLTGCSENNPSGAGVQTTTTGTTTNASTTATSGDLVGLILDTDSNAAINEGGAKLVVTLYQGSTQIGEVDAINNNAFSFQKLDPGFYSLKVSDQANLFRTTFSLVEITAGKTASTTIYLYRSPDASQETVDIVGRAVDVADGAPIMHATIDLLPPGQSTTAYRTTSVRDGYYSLPRIASGTWILKVTKGGYYSTPISLIVLGKKAIYAQGQKITTKTTIPNAGGDGSDLTGFRIGDIKLSTRNAPTGALRGTLRQRTYPFTPLTSATVLELYYRIVPSGIQKPYKIYYGFTTNDQGYLHLTDLPSGYYTVADYGAKPTPRYDGNGNVVDWEFPESEEGVKGSYAGGLFVNPGETTTLPYSGYEK